MNAAEREAFETFIGWIRQAMPSLDGMVPVAFVCLPAIKTNPDGGIDVNVEGPARVIWAKTFPVAERGPLLEHLARPYRDGTVSR